MKSILFFNNQGGLGNASLVYHVAWTFARLGIRVVVADLDPQANLTTLFLGSQRLEEIWLERERSPSIMGAIRPLLSGIDDIESPHIEPLESDLEGAERIGLLVGDPGLAVFEDKLSDAWVRCLDSDEYAFRVTSSFHRLLVQVTRLHECELVLICVGQGLGAINRAAALAAHHLVVPIEPDLVALRCVRYMGTTLQSWRYGWQARLPLKPDEEMPLPYGAIEPAGYILYQHARRTDGPFKDHARYRERAPLLYRQAMLSQPVEDAPPADADEHCLASFNPFRILMPMALAAGKPVFHLTPADGATGAHERAVKASRADFERLATRIAERCQLLLADG